ncbi:MAG TPA: PfkB family carbohydrate kinase [Dongiaceae bacterium]
MTRVLGIGDNTIDLYVDQGIRFPGGNAVNVAVLTHRLGADSAYLGCFGSDAGGDLLRRSLTAEGIDIARCRTYQGDNSWSRVRHLGNDRVFDGSNPGARDRYRLVADDFTYIASHDLVHSSVFSGLEEELPRIKRAAPILSFDYSDRSEDAYFRATAAHVDIAFISSSRSPDAACRELAQRLASHGPRTVIVTRGSQGALALSRGQFIAQPIVQVEAIDTLGAGDGFISAFLMAFMAGGSVASALIAAASYAAEVCTYKGAFGHGVPITPGQPGTA